MNRHELNEAAKPLNERKCAVDPLVMRDIPDAPDWVAHAVDELKEIAEYFDQQGKKSNGDLLRRTANMLEVLAGAYETAKRRAA